MTSVIEELKNSIQGEVRDDPITRRVYSVDASIYEIEPLCVVTPRQKQDVMAAVNLARKFEMGLVPRGAATGITGGCIGNGIVIDLSKYMNRILKIDYQKEEVVCEPGVVQDQLNRALIGRGYRLGPDTSTGNRATLGGMLANNAAGARSLKYGKMVDNVLEVEMILSNGETVRFGEISETEFSKKCLLNGTEGDIYRMVKDIREKYRHEIETKFPKIPRRVSGYNLDELVKPGPINLSKIIAGSEGTFGIVTEITMRIVPVPKKVGLCLVHFEDMIQGMETVSKMLSLHPISLEVMDHHIIEMGKISPSVRDKLDWLHGNPSAVFAIEVEEDSEERLQQRLKEVEGFLQQEKIGYKHVLLTDNEVMSHVWQVRKAGLGLLLSKRSYNRAIAFIEDITVAPERLSEFLREYQNYMRKIDKDSGIYGHAGSGCMHIRPYMDIRNESDQQLMEKIMQDITQMLIRHGGALTGEHGDGLLRSWLNPTLFGPKIYQAFIDLKQSFDPDNRMNPGKIVFPAPFNKNRRIDHNTPIREIETFQDFSKEGGFALAADLCNGNAQCRKPEGTMCPSFQASNDEYHTTRARAQALRAIITGRMGMDELTGEGVRDVLDLCIECKGCKSECPSQVDMAKMKAEVLYHYHEKHGYRLRDKLFAYIGSINRMSFPFSKMVNYLNSTRLAKHIFSSLGIAPERTLPPLSEERFSSWASQQGSIESTKIVVLLSDTFTEFHEPQVGMAAKSVLEALGYSVIVPQWQCCGRTLISKGFLRQAKSYAENLVSVLIPFVEKDYPVIGLEPSCLYTIKDDFQGLLGYNHDKLQKVVHRCQTFDEFLFKHIENNKLPIPLKPSTSSIKFHGHCHQKALGRTSESIKVLKSIPGTIVEEIPTGCCGMAGSFGYEKEHYDFSVKIAGLQLVPALKDFPPDSAVVANGFSCRHQIEHLTPHKPLHLAEILFRSL